MRVTIAVMMSVMSLLITAGFSEATVLGSVAASILGIEDGSLEDRSLAVNKEGLDRESASCLACHDGVTAKDSSSGRRPASVVGMRNTGDSHPVGMPYSGVRSRGRTAYVAEGSLDSAIRLVDGKMSCVSCHEVKALTDEDRSDAFSEDSGLDTCTSTGKLTIRMTGSELCFSCHKV